MTRTGTTITGNFHNESIETASRESIHEMQSRWLRAIVKHVYESKPHSTGICSMRGIRPEDIKTAEDVVKLPMTNKDILRDSYPMKMACVPRDRIAEMHMSSGSTGTPVVMLKLNPKNRPQAGVLEADLCGAAVRPQVQYTRTADNQEEMTSVSTGNPKCAMRDSIASKSERCAPRTTRRMPVRTGGPLEPRGPRERHQT